MNPFLRFLMLALLFSPLSLMAQSPVGSWKFSVPDDNGNMVPLKVTMSEQGTFALDFGVDGVVETKGKYTLEGTKMTIQETEGTECTEIGVYTLKIEGDTLTMTRISDGCPNRGGPEGIIVMKKA